MYYSERAHVQYMWACNSLLWLCIKPKVRLYLSTLVSCSSHNWAHTRVHTHAHTHTHTHTHTDTIISTPTHSYAHWHIYTHTDTFIRTLTHSYTHWPIHTHTDTFTHTYTHWHIHTHTHMWAPHSPGYTASIKFWGTASSGGTHAPSSESLLLDGCCKSGWLVSLLGLCGPSDEGLLLLCWLMCNCPWWVVGVCCMIAWGMPFSMAASAAKAPVQKTKGAGLSVKSLWNNLWVLWHGIWCWMVQEHHSWSPQGNQYSTFGAGWCKSTTAGVHRFINIRPLVLDGVRVITLQP